MRVAHSTRGFTLIEILVAVFVFGMGVLGVAALSATSQKSSLKAYHSMLATWKAQEMMEMMRANANYAKNTFTNYRLDHDDGVPTYSTNCSQSSTFCSDSQMAEYDRALWFDSLSGYLPSASGAVSASGSTFSVTVFWDNGNATQSCSTSGFGAVSLACQSLTFEL